MRPNVHPPLTQTITDTSEVFTPRGYGRIVCRFYGHEMFSGPPAYVIELDDDGGRYVEVASNIQVVDRVAA